MVRCEKRRRLETYRSDAGQIRLVDGTITPLTDTNPPCADIVREMADSADAAGNVTVSAEFLDALADEFEALAKRIAALANDGEERDVNRFRQDNSSNT